MKTIPFLLTLVVFALILYLLFVKPEPLENNANVRKLNITFKDGVNAVNSLNIPYFLTFGTSLGVTRDNSFIPHDDDVDFGVFYEDIMDVDEKHITEIFNLNNFDHHNTDGWECEGAIYPIIYQYRHRITGMLVDIYIFYYRKDLDKFVLYIEGGENTGKGYTFPNIPFKQVKFKDNLFTINPKEWIIATYGENWETPIPGDKGVLQLKELPNNTACIIQPP